MNQFDLGRKGKQPQSKFWLPQRGETRGHTVGFVDFFFYLQLDEVMKPV